MDKLSIVIPCFNESQNMKLVLDRFQELIATKVHGYSLEIIVVDGCSTDGTAAELEKLFADLPGDKFKLLLMSERGGYGKDIVAGLKEASGNILSWTHADMQTDPLDVLTAYELYKKYDGEKIFVKGVRKKRKMIEAFFTFGMQVVTFVLLRVNLHDINAQPKLFSRDFFEKHMAENAPSDFSLDLYAIYQAKKYGYQICTVPVFYLKRQFGEAKGGGGSWGNRINLIKRTFKYILKLKKTII